MSLFAVSGGRFSEFGPMRATVDPASVLAEIEAMSRENDAGETRWTVRVFARGRGLSTTFTRPLPWFEAIGAPMKRTAIQRSSEVAARLFADDAGAMEWKADSDYDASRWVLPTYDGDRPADLSDYEIATARPFAPRAWQPPHSYIGGVLNRREWLHDHRRGESPAARIRETHRAVHSALAGETYDQRYERIKAEGGVIREVRATEATTAPLIAGCPWCAHEINAGPLTD